MAISGSFMMPFSNQSRPISSWGILDPYQILKLRPHRCHIFENRGTKLFTWRLQESAFLSKWTKGDTKADEVFPVANKGIPSGCWT